MKHAVPRMLPALFVKLYSVRAALILAISVCFPRCPLAGQTVNQPITLVQAVSETLEHNLSLLAERYNIPVAEARIVTARLRPNPVLSLGGDHLDVLGTGYNSINAAGPSEYSLRTDFLIERGSKRNSRIAVAENTKSMVELLLLNTARSLVLDVQSAFVEALMAKANLELAQENLQSLTTVVGLNDRRVKLGDLAEVELVRLQLAELQFENTVRQAELRVTTSRAKLHNLLGRARSQPRPDASGDLRRDAPGMVLETLQSQARENRPDAQAIVRDRARSRAEILLQLANGKIDYTVGSEFRRQQGLAGTGNSLGIFFQTNLPVFNRNQGEIERARIEQRQIEARMRALEAAIDNEVEIAYLQYVNAQTNLDKIEKTMLVKARDVRKITQYSYTRGEATLIEFLDGQKAYNDTIQTYNESRAEYARSLYQIDAATGKATR